MFWISAARDKACPRPRLHPIGPTSSIDLLPFWLVNGRFRDALRAAAENPSGPTRSFTSGIRYGLHRSGIRYGLHRRPVRGKQLHRQTRDRPKKGRFEIGAAAARRGPERADLKGKPRVSGPNEIVRANNARRSRRPVLGHAHAPAAVIQRRGLPRGRLGCDRRVLPKVSRRKPAALVPVGQRCEPSLRVLRVVRYLEAGRFVVQDAERTHSWSVAVTRKVRPSNRQK